VSGSSKWAVGRTSHPVLNQMLTGHVVNSLELLRGRVKMHSKGKKRQQVMQPRFER
jgi:hypothetical protein